MSTEGNSPHASPPQRMEALFTFFAITALRGTKDAGKPKKIKKLTHYRQGGRFGLRFRANFLMLGANVWIGPA
jgi:hypothetical protein